MAWVATVVGPRLRARDDEARLVRAAAAGASQAVAALYRRYEARMFNLAFRITGAEQDAADATREAFLEVLGRLAVTPDRERAFGAHLFTAACNASYDAISKRNGVEQRKDASAALDGSGPEGGFEPSAEFADSPLLEDWRDEIHAANDRLSARQREVLALRELGGLSYGEIAQIMGMAQQSVAQLVAAARIELRDQLRGTELGAELTPSEGCDHALQLIAMRDDAELAEGSDHAQWLVGHLAGCHECRFYLDAMQEARLSYSAWEPVAAPAALFGETMARAAELAAQAEGPAESGGGGAAAPSSGGQADERAPGVGRDDVTEAVSPPASTGELRRRRRRELLLAGGWGTALLLGVLAVLVGGVFGSAEGEDSPSEATLAPPAPTQTPTVAERPAARKRAKKRGKEPLQRSVPGPAPRQTARAAPVVVPAPPAEEPARAAPRRRARLPRTEQPRATPPETTLGPEQGVPQPTPAPGGTAPTAPTTPAPEQPPAAGCTNPEGQPVPC